MKTRIFLCILCLATAYGCDVSPEVDRIRQIGLEKSTLELPGDVSSVTLKTDGEGWGIEAFRSANVYSAWEDSLTLLKENTRYIKKTGFGQSGLPAWNETLSYEWIEASQTGDKELLVGVSENTSGEARSLYIQLSTYGLKSSEFLFVVQHPKGRE
jgi:hypothetical protein